MTITIAQSAANSVSAVLGIPQHDSYTDESLAACVPKPEGHVEPPLNLALLGMLYSITTIARNEKFGGTRTVAICTSLTTACRIVEGNHGDIWEHSYMLAVIEAVWPNALYGGLKGRDTYWYRWSVEKKAYEAIETPDAYQKRAGFGIG